MDLWLAVARLNSVMMTREPLVMTMCLFLCPCLSAFLCFECMFVCVISAGGPSFFLLHLPLTPLPPWCDNYLVVMDKVEVLAVEVVRPGHRSRGDRSKDRVLVPPSISPLSSSPMFFFNTKQQLKVTSNKATTFKLIYTTKKFTH